MNKMKPREAANDAMLISCLQQELYRIWKTGCQEGEIETAAQVNLLLDEISQYKQKRGQRND